MLFMPEFWKAMALVVAEVCRLEEEDAEKVVAEVEASVEKKPSMVAAITTTSPTESTSDVPTWAKNLTDMREGTSYGPEQYTMLVGLKEHLVVALVDSGGEKSMMDVQLAE